MTWRRIVQPLFKLLGRILAGIRKLARRTLRGADVLKGGSGRHTRLRRPRGSAPWYAGGWAPEPPPMHPRVQTVYRNAVFFLFDHCDLGVVPAQFWPFLAAVQDPGDAVASFLRAIGCDPQRIGRGDRVEREKAAEIIDFLVMSGDLLDRLSPEARNSLGLALEAGDYSIVRRAARIASELRGALDVETRWKGESLIPSFQSLLSTIRRLAENPLSATPDDAENAARLARAYSAAQTDFNELTRQYDDLVAQLTDIWPHTGWSAEPEEAALKRTCAGFDTTTHGLRTVANLNIDQVQLALRTMRMHFAELERLLDRARSAASGARAHHDSRTGSSGSDRRSEKDRIIDEALAFFGYSRDYPPTEKELQRKYRELHAELHRRNPSDKEDRQKQINIYRDHVRDFLKDLTRAAA